MNLKTDSTGDLEVTNNQLVLVTGADEITQLVGQRLNTFYGEWFLDNTIGVPWFQRILEKGVQPSSIEAIIVKEILDTDGVLEITELTMDLDESTRNLAITSEMRVESDPDLIEFFTNIGA